MVPPQEPVEYLYELRGLSESTARDRCETFEVHLPTPTQHETDVHGYEVEVQDSVSTTPSPSLNVPQNLTEDLDVVGKSQTAEAVVVVAVDTFAEVSQIAEEVVLNATY